MEKNVNAFRSISEAAIELDIPQHVLRFWETRFSQIKPMKRGGGRRFYRADDIELLRAIRHLLYGEGYTIKGVQRLLKENGQKAVIALALSGGTRPLAGPGARDYLASDEVVFQAPLHRGEAAAFVSNGHEGEAGQDHAEAAYQASGQDFTIHAPSGSDIQVHKLIAPSHAPSITGGESSGHHAHDLGEDVRPKLRWALAELDECRRILNAAA